MPARTEPIRPNRPDRSGRATAGRRERVRGHPVRSRPVRLTPAGGMPPRGDDPAVPVEHFREMFEAFKAGGNPKYTEYPGVGHGCWDRAYSEKELWVWLKKQKKE
jgi:hypothetical protein